MWLHSFQPGFLTQIFGTIFKGGRDVIPVWPVAIQRSTVDNRGTSGGHHSLNALSPSLYLTSQLMHACMQPSSV